MSDLIKRLFMFLLPIVRKAVVEVAADELYKAAYPQRPRRRTGYGYTGYAPRPSRMQDYAKRDVAATKNLFEEKARFHDVLLVAFDITGPNASLVQGFLEAIMPETGEHDNGINLDSWWIADDHNGTSDCDSAVFVSKGHQAHARTMLRSHGLVT